MAFLSRLFRRGDPLAEREEARRQGMRDARRHPLGEFTDPEFQPAYVTEIRARAREQITEVDRQLAATRTALTERALGEREIILRELGRSDTLPQPFLNGHTAEPHPDTAEARPGAGAGAAAEAARSTQRDPFISIAEARALRAEARRRALVEEANAGVQRARARIEHLTQEWESALMRRDHEVEAVQARAEQLIAAYKSGVLRAHPRKEEIPSLWKGEIIAMDATAGNPMAVSGRREIGRILREVEDRIEVWHAEVLPRELPGHSRTQLSPGGPPAADDTGSEENPDGTAGMKDDPDSRIGATDGPGGEADAAGDPDGETDTAHDPDETADAAGDPDGKADAPDDPDGKTDTVDHPGGKAGADLADGVGPSRGQHGAPTSPRDQEDGV
ncbi:hypothetical protein E1295_06610 [Nonomuraea mesophila]|uniref:Uncharacterized protein n=1 Tax=Nonomuraea mesophila TaxID=2530382 RepID=A0A4R5FUQ8_9ACTN|nr:hypothetical protein [Nonomuraea mesophila]TDE57946.1 hypothetical protein E1295_06610 [Nonomuraea mesophila]